MLSTFQYINDQEFRVLEDKGEYWFVAQDACKALDLSDTSKACSRLDEDEKLIRTLFVSGQNRDVLTVSESGLYSLILTSRKEEAKVFKRWVTHEVLPAIRKQGYYQIQPQPQEQTVATWVIDRFLKLEEEIAMLQDQRKQHKIQIDSLQAIIDEADQLWFTFPEPQAKIPTTTRQLILLLVHHAVIKFRRPIGKIWEETYAYFRFRSGFDAKARARHTSEEPLDIIFENGMGEAFYTACYEYLVERHAAKYSK